MSSPWLAAIALTGGLGCSPEVESGPDVIELTDVEETGDIWQEQDAPMEQDTPSLPDTYDTEDTNADSNANTSTDTDTEVEAPLLDIALQSAVTQVQPLTGIVLWETSWNNGSIKTTPGNIALEYSYVGFDSVAVAEGVYDWSSLDALLDRIAGRGNQAIIRLYATYRNRETALPGWLKARAGYNETQGLSEGQNTWFPDWTSTAVKY